MKKITFIRAVETQFGGAENFLTRLCGALQKRGVAFDALHSHLPKWLPSWLRAWLFNFHLRLQKGKRFYFALDRIDSADIYRAGDGVHKAYIKTRHRSFNPLHWTYCALEKRCFENAKRIIANSEKVKRDLLTEYDIPESKIRVVYNGISMPTLDRLSARQNLESEFPEIKNKAIILMAGTGFERKGVPAFLDKIQGLKIPFHAFIVGKDKNSFKYENLAEALNLQAKVTFTGMRSDMDQFYQSADLFLFLPDYEPFGNVVLEALSYGVPVFSHAKCGASELLPNDWRIDDATTATDKIENLLTDQSTWQAASEQALSIAKSFPIEKTTLETLAIIKEVMNEH